MHSWKFKKIKYKGKKVRIYAETETEAWNKMIDLIIADFESLKRKSADGKEPVKFLTKDIKYDIM